MFIAVVDWTAENRIAKYQDFATETDALAHVKRIKDRYPKAFVAAAPNGGFADWLVGAGTLSYSPPPEPPPVKLLPTDAEVVTRALMDKATLTQTDLDTARAALSP